MKEFNYRNGKLSFARAQDIPTITKPALFDLVEVMRGCGRNCDFCEPNLRAVRSIPYDMIEDEITVNVNHGGKSAWLHSEDVWLYKLEDHKNMIPNEDALLELFQRATAIPGVTAPPHPTHGTIAPAAYSPEMIQKNYPNGHTRCKAMAWNTDWFGNWFSQPLQEDDAEQSKAL